MPWLRGHLGGMVEELLEGATIGADLAALRESLKRMVSRPDPRRLAVELRDEGLVTLVTGPAQRELLRRLQATMAVIEGYAEHVMDAVGDALDPGYARLRAAIEAERRRRGMLDAIAIRLLGLDMKLRQYGLGKRFADFVAARSGVTGLNAVWREPGALPGPDELESPERWTRARDAERAGGRQGTNIRSVLLCRTSLQLSNSPKEHSPPRRSRRCPARARTPEPLRRAPAPPASPQRVSVRTPVRRSTCRSAPR